MTDVLKLPILESSRTTYFDNLKDNGTESGNPSGALKIREGSLSYPDWKRREPQKKREIKEVLGRTATLYGEDQTPLMC